jgi:hypothetical protein
MHLFLETGAGELVHLEIQPNDELIDVKRKIQELTTIPVDEQSLSIGETHRNIKRMKHIRSLQSRCSATSPLLYVTHRKRRFALSTGSRFSEAMTVCTEIVNPKIFFSMGFPYSFS